MNQPRWAAPADNAALIELVRACPMRGDIDLYFDRAPDFFALGALQGAGAQVCVVDDAEPGRLAACAAVADYPAVYVGGEARPARYACDLRVRPERRRGLLLKWVYDFHAADAAASGVDLGFTTVMAGNAAMAPVLGGRAGLVPYLHVATMRNYAVQLLFRRLPPRGIEVRPATAGDAPAMADLWNRLQAAKQFAPAWEAEELCRRLARPEGPAAGDHYLAFRGERLVGLCAAWDQSTFKRMVVLGYGPRLRRLRRWYDPLAWLLGRARFPAPGLPLPYCYATHLCAETPEDLQALLTRLHNDRLGQRYLFVSAVLDERDPLNEAFRGFISNAFAIELFALDPLHKWASYSFSDRVAYFDPGMV